MSQPGKDIMSSDRFTIATGRASTTFSGTRDAVAAHARKLSEVSAAEIEVRDSTGTPIACFRGGVEVTVRMLPRAVAPVTERPPPRRVWPPGANFALVRRGAVVRADSSEAALCAEALTTSATYPGEVLTVYDARGKIVGSYLRGVPYKGPPSGPVPPEWFVARKPKKRR
jgi:hypothetical protein